MHMWGLAIGAFIVLVVSTIVFVAARYKRCPADRILVVYGKGLERARCIHGGAAFVLPLIQDYAYLSLEPIRTELDLMDFGRTLVLSVAIGTEPEQMDRAAERLLGLTQHEISELAHEIVTSEGRRVMAALEEQGDQGDTEALLDEVARRSEPALHELGLVLVNLGVPLRS